MQFKPCFLAVSLCLICCTLGYAQKAKECSELQLKIREYEETLKTATYEKVAAELENARKEFDGNCRWIIDKYKSTSYGCFTLFKAHKNAAGKYEYDAQAANMYSPGANFYFSEDNMPPKEDKEYIESILFYSCIPEFEEEEQREQEQEKQRQLQLQKEKAALEAYFAQCPKGLTTTSFDCYKLDDLFVNRGFRGVELERGVPGADVDPEDRDYETDYLENTIMYGARGKDVAINIFILDGIIREIDIEFFGEEETYEAILASIKKKFPQLKREGYYLVEETDTHKFRGRGGQTLVFVSKKLEEILKEKQKAEEQKKKEMAAKHAEDLF